jgi:hypothetical protein
VKRASRFPAATKLERKATDGYYTKPSREDGNMKGPECWVELPISYSAVFIEKNPMLSGESGKIRRF